MSTLLSILAAACIFAVLLTDDAAFFTTTLTGAAVLIGCVTAFGGVCWLAGYQRGQE